MRLPNGGREFAGLEMEGEHGVGGLRGALADASAVASEAEGADVVVDGCVGMVARGAGDADGADGLVLGAAGGSGDARDREGVVGVLESLERAYGHGAGDRLRDRAVLIDQLGGDGEQIDLRSVGVGDEASLEDVGGACEAGDHLGEEAAGTAFGEGEAVRTPAEPGEGGFDERGLAGREDVVGEEGVDALFEVGDGAAHVRARAFASDADGDDTL